MNYCPSQGAPLQDESLSKSNEEICEMLQKEDVSEECIDHVVQYIDRLEYEIECLKYNPINPELLSLTEEIYKEFIKGSRPADFDLKAESAVKATNAFMEAIKKLKPYDL